MNNKKTENTDETSTTTENATSDNKRIFGPLGKYAVVAMIMVSIIVTTAIMLNKQLGTVEEQLAVMEIEVAERNAAMSGNTVTTEISEATVSSSTISEEQKTAEVAEVEITPAEAQANEIQATEDQVAEVLATEVQADEALAAEALVAEDQAAEVLLATENTEKETVPEAVVSTDQTGPIDVAVIEPAMSKNSAVDSQTQFAMEKRDQERQARLESFKLEQKQHMTEMFARIKSLESKQLDQYKMHQDKQIGRLRQQVAEQEQLIEALILRNKERVGFREASMQRSQSNREKMLNRI